MTRNCEVCQAEIPQQAIKCTKCGSYQGAWRRLLFGGQAAALTQLLPVLALAAAFISTQLKTVGSDITIFDPDCSNPGGITLTASNLGDRSAVIEPRALKVMHLGKEQYEYTLKVQEESNRHLLVPAGEIISRTLAPQNGVQFMTVPDNDDCDYVIGLSVIEFDADAVSKEVRCTCAS